VKNAARRRATQETASNGGEWLVNLGLIVVREANYKPAAPIFVTTGQAASIIATYLDC